jgi:dTDP-4-amino-4,6-dideoxygalactose transaminase
MRIPLLDLKAQYNSIKNELETVVKEVLESNQFILGPKVEELEKAIAEYCGVTYGVGVASGTDALILVLTALGVGSGDEVITTPFTFFATAEAISRVGARPVFVDIDPNSYNINVELIEEKITDKTKALLPVHLFGQPANMIELKKICQEYSLLLVEDACQAIGAKYEDKMVGSWGDAACFSFFPSKNLACAGDGGMVVTNDALIAEKVKLLRHHGSRQKYFHEILGYNSRLDAIQAAILNIKLKYLNFWNNQRREKAAYYNQLLADLPVKTPFEDNRAKHVYHLYVIRTPRREKIRQALFKNGIASGVYYPLPLHLQKAYAHLGYKPGDFPEAEKASQEVLALPLYPELPLEAVEEIVTVIRSVLTKKSKSLN